MLAFTLFSYKLVLVEYSIELIAEHHEVIHARVRNLNLHLNGGTVQNIGKGHSLWYQILVKSFFKGF